MQIRIKIVEEMIHPIGWIENKKIFLFFLYKFHCETILTVEGRMITMTEFNEIKKYRNEGRIQKDIANIVGRSMSTVRRYLSSDKFPVYRRTKKTKEDLFAPYKERVDEIIKNKVNGRIPKCGHIYQTIKKEGYAGSLRTLQRKTYEIRRSLKSSEIYFEQSFDSGKMVEGDFTEILIPFEGGKEKRHLWMMASKNTKGCYCKSFNNETFESFAEGVSEGFNYFGGVFEILRLDNLKPAVKKIIKNKRYTTHRFNQLIAHYGFIASFCTPGKGNEKGTVESTNKHVKSFLEYEIALENKIFSSEEEFEEYLELKLKKYNELKFNEMEKEKKYLKSLPVHPFPAFREEIFNVSKYGFIKAGGMRYSVPSEYKYRDVEARIYSKKIEIFYKGEKIKEHKRCTKERAAVVLDYKDLIDALIRKPGALTNYKHKEAFFPTNIFKEFYNIYNDNKNYLKCLNLYKEYDILEIETSIQILLEEKIKPEPEKIIELLNPNARKEENNFNNLLKPLSPDLDKYNKLLSAAEGETHEREIRI